MSFFRVSETSLGKRPAHAPPARSAPPFRAVYDTPLSLHLHELPALHNYDLDCTLGDVAQNPSSRALSNPSTVHALCHVKSLLYAFVYDPRFKGILFGPDAPTPVQTSSDYLYTVSYDFSLSETQERLLKDDSGLQVEYRKDRRGKACGHVFRIGETVYRCG